MEILPLPSSNEKPITSVVRYLDEQPAVIVGSLILFLLTFYYIQ